MYFRSKIEIDLMNSEVKINKLTPRSGISYLKVKKNPKQQTYYPSYSQFKEQQGRISSSILFTNLSYKK